MQTVKLSSIVPDPDQPRQEFDPVHLRLLEKSIASQGILNPLVIEDMGQGKYLLIDGERRYRASKNLGLKEVPATIVPAMNEFDRLIKRFHLQEQARAWNYLDKATAIRQLSVKAKLPSEEIGRALGLPANQLVDLLNIAKMSNEERTIIQQKKVPFQMSVKLARILKKLKAEKRIVTLDALADKIARGIVMNASEIEVISKAITVGGAPIVKALISKPDMGHNEAADMAGIKESIQADYFVSALGHLTLKLRSLHRIRTKRELTKNQIKNLKEMHSLVGDILKTVG